MTKTKLKKLEELLYEFQEEVKSEEDKESISSIIDLCQTQN